MHANSAAAVVVLATGKPSHVLCAWCLAVTDPHEQFTARYWPHGGNCELCSYSDDGCPRGSDIFIVANPHIPQCPAQALTILLVEQRLRTLPSCPVQALTILRGQRAMVGAR